MKRLLCIVSAMNTGGAETFLMKMYRSLDRKKYQMDFCVNSDENFYEQEILKLGGKIYKIPAKSQNVRKWHQELKRVVRENGYQYVIRVCEHSLAVLDLLVAPEGGAKQLIMRSSNTGSGSKKSTAIHKCFRFLPKTVPTVKLAPSTEAAEYTFGKGCVQRGEAFLLHNAIDTNVYCFSESGRERLRKELGLEGNAVLRSALKKLNYIYVETSTMKRSLEKQGFKNVVILPNFKDLRILPESELVYPQGEPYRLCTFSRVMKEKGIGDAVEAVKAVNEKLGRTAFALDIFGQVDSGQTDWFERLTESFPEYIHYRGCVPFNKSVGILKDYFCLLFPTRFFTEGIPGTILDAYAAGVPVISARWESFSDVVDDGVTGIGFDFCNQSDLEKTLYKVANEPNLVLEKKKSCVSAARKYTPNEAMCVLYRRFTR